MDPHTLAGLGSQNLSGGATDIFDYAYQQYKEHMTSEGRTLNPVIDASIQGFAAFARKIYGENRPTAMDYLGGNLGFRFQNGMVLALTDQALTMEANVGYMPVGKVDGGILPPSHSFPVTTGSPTKMPPSGAIPVTKHSNGVR